MNKDLIELKDLLKDIIVTDETIKYLDRIFTQIDVDSYELNIKKENGDVKIKEIII
jgi:hypothetical protein